MEKFDILKEVFLSPIEDQFYWAGIYRKLSDRAKRLCFVGPMPPCHEFEFSKGNVGMTADQGVRKVVADVTEDDQYSQCFIQVASEIVEPISEITIAGNLKDMFKSLIAADDLEYTFATNVPTLRTDSMTVAGG